MKKTNALYRKKSDIDNCSNKSASKQKITMTFSSVANRIKSLFKLLTSRPVYRTSGQRTSDPINYVEIKTPTGFRRIEQDVLDGSKYRVVEQNDQVKTTTYYERNCSTFRIVEKEGFKQETTFVIDRDEQGRRIAVIKRDVIQRVGEPTRYREFHPDGRLKKLEKKTLLLNTFLGKEYTDRGRIANFTYRDKEGKIYRGTEQEMLTLYKQQLYSFVSHKVVRHKALENVFERMKNSFSRAA